MALHTDILREKIFEFYSGTSNDILKIEENTAIGRPADLSLKEIHVVEAVARITGSGKAARALDVSAVLRVAPGTLTAAADLLEKKGYLARERDKKDKRGVCIQLTEKGERARDQHRAFHNELVDEILTVVGAEDAKALLRSLDVVRSFYVQKEAALRKVKTRILTDSSCDLSPEHAQALGVTLVPMSIMFGEVSYRQNVDISSSDFYRLLAESKVQPVTTQLTPFTLEQTYSEATSDGSEVVAIHLASALSGSYQSAVIASREVPGVYTVDSQSGSFGIALLVSIAADLRDKGKSAAEIAGRLSELSERVTIIAYIPTLKYLVRGGRLSATAGVVGSLLNIFPLVGVRDGAIRSEGKAKGKKAACQEVARLISVEGIDREYGVVFGHAAAPDDVGALKDAVAPLIEGCESFECEIGSVIGTHTGPGAVGIAFIRAR